MSLSQLKKLKKVTSSFLLLTMIMMILESAFTIGFSKEVFAATNSLTLSGTVTDYDTNNPISGVTVTFDKNGSSPVKVTTGTSGSYRLTPSHSGSEDICAEKSGYDTVTDTVTISTNQTTKNFVLKKSKPGTPTITESTTAMTNGNVTITVSYPNSPTVKKISIDNGVNWTDYKSSITLSSNQTVRAKSQSSLGVWSDEGLLVVTNIDKSIPDAPILSQDTTDLTGSVVVTATFLQNAASKMISTDAGTTWTNYTAPITITANKTIKAKQQNYLGTWSTVTSLVVSNIYGTPPAPTWVEMPKNQASASISVKAVYPSFALNKKYSLDGVNWIDETGNFVNLPIGTMIRAKYTDSLGNTSDIGTFDEMNGDWYSKNVIRENTSEADLMVRSGDIDNFGYTWKYESGSFNVFSGNSTNVHKYPWTTPSDEPQGLDKIMVVSSYDYSQGTISQGGYSAITTKAHTDGYTSSTRRTVYNGYASNQVQSINLNYDLGGISAKNAILQMFVDDFQAGNSRDVESQVSYQVKINNVRIPELEQLINSLDQSGPIGRVISFRIPDAYMSLVNTGSLSINIDDPVIRINGGDGYAIDFVKLLINPSSLSQTCTVSGTVIDYATKQALAGVQVSAGGVVKTTTDGNGKYTLNKVPSGLAIVTATMSGYSDNIQQINNAVTGGNYTLDFQMKSTLKPGIPKIYENIMTTTNQDVVITVDYPDNPTVKKIYVNNNWIDYTGPVTVSYNQTINAKSQSAAGVDSDVASFDIVNIDKSIPNAPVLTPDITVPTNKSVTVTAIYPANAVNPMISIDTGHNWFPYTDAVILDNNATVEAKYRNTAGTWSQIGILVINNIDKLPPNIPVFSADITVPTNQNVTVAVNYTADSNIKEYSLDNGNTWLNYTTPIVMHDNGVIQARGTDLAGNISAVASFNVDNIDKILPDTPTFTEDNTLPTNKPVNVTITYSADSVVKEYSLDKGDTWKVYTTAVNMSDNGNIEARGTDAAGNVSLIGSFDVTNIDLIAPEKPEISEDNDKPTNLDVNITINYSEDSLIKEYSLDKGRTWTDYSGSIDMSDNGTIMARGTDAASNVSDVTSFDVTNIDKMAPDAPAIVPDITLPTNTDVIVTITYAKDAEKQQYSLDKGVTWLNYTGSITMLDNGNVQAKAIDLAGNVSKISDLDINNIDKIPPLTPNLHQDVTVPTNQDVHVTIDNWGDAVIKEYSFDGTHWSMYTGQVTVSDNRLVYGRGIDDVGNISDVGSINITNIDKLPPAVPTFISSNQQLTNQDVYVTINYPNDVVVKEYSTDNINWVTYSSSIDMSQNGTIYGRGRDAAGNVSEVSSFSVGNIDKVAPTAAIMQIINSDTSVSAILCNQSEDIYVIDAQGVEHLFKHGDTASDAETQRFTVNGTAVFNFRDLAGNTGTISQNVVVGRTTPPDGGGGNTDNNSFIER